MPKRRFTAFEFIVAVAIIAILAACIAPGIAGRVGDARIGKAKSDIRVLESSFELYNSRTPPARAARRASMRRSTSPRGRKPGTGARAVISRSSTRIPGATNTSATSRVPTASSTPGRRRGARPRGKQLPKCDGRRWEDLPTCGRFMRHRTG